MSEHGCKHGPFPCDGLAPIWTRGRALGDCPYQVFYKVDYKDDINTRGKISGRVSVPPIVNRYVTLNRGANDRISRHPMAPLRTLWESLAHENYISDIHEQLKLNLNPLRTAESKSSNVTM
ncbi:hypothetical protein J6590_097306 [Homalodisca vitripennis]|nr:hypothetical protein J6590_097306 [Homalodisca vitripennis]